MFKLYFLTYIADVLVVASVTLNYQLCNMYKIPYNLEI
jgi:hypothetical protein